MKKVVSFCLWGNIPKYNVGLIENVRDVNRYYPNFESWVYIHVPSVPESTIKKLKTVPNVKIIEKYVQDISPARFMSWRFEPYDSAEVELFISRDTDSRIQLREVVAVEEWLNTNKLLHIIRDSPCHYPVILGGMFGLRKSDKFSDMTGKIDDYFLKNLKNDDQCFLRDVVVPVMGDDIIVHTDIPREMSGTSENTHTMLRYNENYNFIGEYIDENGRQDDYYRAIQQNFVENYLFEKSPRDIDVKHCVLACDDNPFYYEFYPIVKEYWNRIKIKTILILVAEKIPNFLETYREDIILFKPVLGIPAGFQAQVIRLLYPCLFDHDEGIIISDMDILPLSNSFFHPKVNEQRFVVLRNVIEDQKQYPICYCCAIPPVWRLIFKIKNEDDIRSRIKEWFPDEWTASSPYSIGWATDQLKLYSYLQNWKDILITFKDEETKFQRLDRINLNTITLGVKYTDFHMPRPFSENIHIIEELLHNIS